jgi:hypothetical protein
MTEISEKIPKFQRKSRNFAPPLRKLRIRTVLPRDFRRDDVRGGPAPGDLSSEKKE